MKARAAIGFALLAICLCACQSTDRRDNTGTAVQLSEPKRIEPYETRFNIAALLPKGSIVSIERIVRDNSATYEGYFVLSDQGFRGRVLTQSSGGGYRWNEQPAMTNEAAFRKMAEGKLGVVREVRVLRHRNEKVGFMGIGATGAGDNTCVIATAAYLLEGPTGGFRSGAFDTGLTVDLCGRETAERASRIVEDLDLVRDRSAYRLAVEGR